MEFIVYASLLRHYLYLQQVNINKERGSVSAGVCSKDQSKRRTNASLVQKHTMNEKWEQHKLLFSSNGLIWTYMKLNYFGKNNVAMSYKVNSERQQEMASFSYATTAHLACGLSARVLGGVRHNYSNRRWIPTQHPHMRSII